MISVSSVLASLDPPPSALALHRAASAAVFAILDDEDHRSIGVTAQQLAAEFDGPTELPAQQQEQIARVCQLARTETFDWMPVMRELAAEADTWVKLICLDLCVHNSLISEERLMRGAVGSRLGAVFEACRLGSTPWELQTSYNSLCVQVSEGRVSDFTNAALVVSEAGANFALGWLGVFDAFGWLSKAKTSVHGALSEVDESSRELAHTWLIASSLSEDEQDRFDALAKSVRHTRQQALRDGDTGRARMSEAMYAQLTADRPERRTDVDVVPDLLGLPLERARQLLGALGAHRVLEMNVSETSGFLSSLLKDKVVRCVEPREGTPLDPTQVIALAYAKPGERVREPAMRAQLRDLIAESEA